MTYVIHNNLEKSHVNTGVVSSGAARAGTIVGDSPIATRCAEVIADGGSAGDAACSVGRTGRRVLHVSTSEVGEAPAVTHVAVTDVCYTSDTRVLLVTFSLERLEGNTWTTARDLGEAPAIGGLSLHAGESLPDDGASTGGRPGAMWWPLVTGLAGEGRLSGRVPVGVSVGGAVWVRVTYGRWVSSPVRVVVGGVGGGVV